MAENNEGWEVWAERLPDVETKQELPEGVWEDYKKYQMLNGREGDWSAPEMKNPDALTKIRNLMSKVKDLPNTMSYYAHKVADPMYANVDYMGQQVGDWAAKKINNIARAFDVSPEARQYGRFEEEEYDPEAVDVRFGRNAYKEGYDSLGEYFNAKDKYEKDYQTYRNALDDPMAWYADANGEDVLSEPQDPNPQFASLTGTGSYKNWKPESKVGKVVKGASGIAGDMLPEMLEGWGGEVAMGALAPVYAKAKEYIQAKKLGTEASVEPMIVSEGSGLTIKAPAEYAPRKARESYELRKGGEEIASMRKNRGRFNKAKKQLTTDEYDELLKKVDKRDPQRYIDEAIYDHDIARQADINSDPATVKSIARNARGDEAKPLPNPAAQSNKDMAKTLRDWRDYYNRQAHDYEVSGYWEPYQEPNVGANRRLAIHEYKKANEIDDALNSLDGLSLEEQNSVLKALLDKYRNID